MADAAQLARYEDVRPLDEEDQPVLDEVRAVLEKHNCTNRFGVTLLHRHFAMAPNEVLVETIDEERRILTIRPMELRSDWDLEATATSWQFEAGNLKPMSRLQCFPVKDKDGNVIGHMK